MKVKSNKIFKVLGEFGFHAKDVKFLDGYFIFEHGKDMVVHFHLKECKGWLFAIWWDLEDENKYEFFAQYEETIDKFKPTASTFVKSDLIYESRLSKLKNEVKWDIVPIVSFIKKHPYVAWSYDIGYERDCWNYVTGFEAFKQYWKYRLDEHKKVKRNNKLNKKYLRLVKEVCDGCLINYKIIDECKNGVRCYPRYFVVCEGIVDEETEGGSYFVEVDKEEKKLVKKLEKFDKLLGKAYGYYDVEMFHGGVSVFVKKSGVDKTKKK